MDIWEIEMKVQDKGGEIKRVTEVETKSPNGKITKSLQKKTLTYGLDE